MCFILIINVTFQNQIDMNTFIKNFLILQKYCLEEEKQFLFQYEYAISDQEKFQLVIIEKYDNKDSYLNIHRNSVPFKHFKKATSTLNIIINGHSYYL